MLQGARRVLLECVHLPPCAHARIRVHVFPRQSLAQSVVLHHHVRCQVPPVGAAFHDPDHGWLRASSFASYRSRGGSHVRLPDAHLAHFRWRHELHNYACCCEGMVWRRCRYATGEVIWYGSAGTLNSRCSCLRPQHRYEPVGTWPPSGRISFAFRVDRIRYQAGKRTAWPLSDKA